MDNEQKQLTFRVRRVPADVTLLSLAAFLNHSIEGLGGENNIRARSLAISPYDHGITRTQTATVEFGLLPVLFSDSKADEWVFPLNATTPTLLFDVHFSGFTPLNNVDAIEHDLDCIAISGLGSHPFGSWRQRTASGLHQFMWLRDQLPDDFPNMRIMIYGYETNLIDSHSFQNIDDLALMFIRQLEAIGRAEQTARPLVILAHSLGGILVKQAVCLLARSRPRELFMLSLIQILLFFGVPNRGMQTKHLHAMVKGHPNRNLVATLSTESVYLRHLDSLFSGNAELQGIRVVSAYETAQSPIAVEQSPGIWLRDKHQLETLVTRESAIQVGCRDPEDIFPVDRNHSALVKFSPDDHIYSIVRSYIRNVMKENKKQSVKAGVAEIHEQTGATVPTLPVHGF